jgi:hypothetical protein
MFLVSFMPEYLLVSDRDNSKAVKESLDGLLLSASHTNYDRRDIFHIHKGVIKFRPSEMGEINDIVRNLSNFASDLFSRSQVQFDSFAGAALKDTDYSCIRLDGGFFLGEQAGASNRRNNDSKKT